MTRNPVHPSHSTGLSHDIQYIGTEHCPSDAPTVVSRPNPEDLTEDLNPGGDCVLELVWLSEKTRSDGLDLNLSQTVPLKVPRILSRETLVWYYDEYVCGDKVNRWRYTPELPRCDKVDNRPSRISRSSEMWDKLNTTNSRSTSLRGHRV